MLPAGNHYLARCHAHFKLPHANARHKPTKPSALARAAGRQGQQLCGSLAAKATADGTRPKLAVRITTPTGKPAVGFIPAAIGPGRRPIRMSVLFEANLLRSGRPAALDRSLSMAPTRHSSRSHAHGAVRNLADRHQERRWRGLCRRVGPARRHAVRLSAVGRQSRFDDDKYVRFDLAGRPEEEDDDGELHPPAGTSERARHRATHDRRSVAFRHSDRKASRYSGAGPVRRRARSGRRRNRRRFRGHARHPRRWHAQRLGDRVERNERRGAAGDAVDFGVDDARVSKRSRSRTVFRRER